MNWFHSLIFTPRPTSFHGAVRPLLIFVYCVAAMLIAGCNSENTPIDVELLRMPRADHNFLTDYLDGAATVQSLEAMLTFFDETL